MKLETVDQAAVAFGADVTDVPVLTIEQFRQNRIPALLAAPAGEKTSLEGTAMDVTAFPLSHSGGESTAFLIDSGDDALLCFGDTGPDSVEQTTRIKDVWGAVAGRVKQKQLRGVIVEVSYTNAQPDKFPVRASGAELPACGAEGPRIHGRAGVAEGPARGDQPYQLFAQEGRGAPGDHPARVAGEEYAAGSFHRAGAGPELAVLTDGAVMPPGAGRYRQAELACLHRAHVGAPASGDGRRA